MDKYQHLPMPERIDALQFDLTKICDIVKEATPILLKIRKWVSFSAKFKRIIDSIIAISSISCPENDAQK